MLLLFWIQCLVSTVSVLHIKTQTDRTRHDVCLLTAGRRLAQRDGAVLGSGLHGGGSCGFEFWFLCRFQSYVDSLGCCVSSWFDFKGITSCVHLKLLSRNDWMLDGDVLTRCWPEGRLNICSSCSHLSLTVSRMFDDSAPLLTRYFMKMITVKFKQHHPSFTALCAAAAAVISAGWSESSQRAHRNIWKASSQV